MAPSSKQVRTLVSPAGSVVAERVPKGTQQPFKAEMSGSKSPFHSGRRRTDVPRTSCAPSELLWATSITELQGLLRLLIRVRIPGGSYPALSTKWIRLPHSQCGDTGSNPVGVIRWLLRSSVIITGGSSMGELLIKTNPARDFNSNFKNCYPKAEVIGSNPIHRAVGHIQQYQPMAP